MPPSGVIEKNQYSAWDDDDFVPESGFNSGEPEAAQAAHSVVAIEFIADAVGAGERLDKWLAARMPEHSRSRIRKWIEAGHVRVNGEPLSGSAPIRRAIWSGDAISVAPQRAAEDSAFAPEAIALEIAFEDDALLVLNKRAGLVVHPAAGNWSGTVLNGLLHHAPRLAALPRAGIVHRLDKDTSGLMVVAKTEAAQTDLVRQLQARSVGRTYVAIVHGTPPARGRVDAPIGRHPKERTRMAALKPEQSTTGTHTNAKAAATNFETLRSIAARDRHGPLAVVLCKLETGRTHQIRVHMQAIGYPLVGDPVYGKTNDTIGFARQALHAWQLALNHPVTRERCRWTAPLPADMTALLRQLGIDAQELLDAAVRDE